MRNFKTGLIALAASAAFLVPATGALAGTQSQSTAASSAGGNDCTGLVNVCQFTVLDGANTAVLSGINVVAALAACPNLDVTALSALVVGGQKASCSNAVHSNYKFIQRTQ
jgi:hypothetical protein